MNRALGPSFRSQHMYVCTVYPRAHTGNYSTLYKDHPQPPNIGHVCSIKLCAAAIKVGRGCLFTRVVSCVHVTQRHVPVCTASV